MTIRTFRGMLILFLVVFIASCGEEESIDDDYLDSKQYQQFKEKQAQEYTEYVDDRESLQQLLEALGKCTLSKKWSYPIQFDDQVLSQVNSSCKSITNKYKSSFSVYPIGYSEFGNVTIRWIKLNKQTGYKDIELWAATYQGDSLISFKSIGVFQDNLSKDVTTNITINNHGGYLSISSSMKRGIKYPFEYDNVIESSFRIDTLGTIN